MAMPNRSRLISTVVVIAAVGFSVALYSASRAFQSRAAEGPEQLAENQATMKPRVEVVHPTEGGILRVTSQPGSAISYESADLFPKLSGFLKTLAVDIGSRVKEGDVLAELDVPELELDVLAAKANFVQAVAEVFEGKALIESVIAEQKAAEAKVGQARSEIERLQSEVKLAEKQLSRTRELLKLRAIEERIVDERSQQLVSATAMIRAAESTVVAAEQHALSVSSRVALARATLTVTEAKMKVAEARLDRAKVMASYAQITSPYDGVVTARNFHRGAYVRSPDQGGDLPLVAVDRTDMMRVVVRIPDRDVPHVHPGDSCEIQFDALPLTKLQASISRIAATEDSATRTMMVEIDVPNVDGLIKDHMYGRVNIALEESAEGLTIPSTCLVGDTNDGQATVLLVQDGVLTLTEVQIGRDTGVETEVLSGLSMADFVVVRPANGLSSGLEVEAVSTSSTAKLH